MQDDSDDDDSDSDKEENGTDSGGEEEHKTPADDKTEQATVDAGDGGETVTKGESGDAAQEPASTKEKAKDPNESSSDEDSSEDDDASVVDEQVAPEEEPANPLDILVFPSKAVEKVTPGEAKKIKEDNEEDEADDEVRIFSSQYPGRGCILMPHQPRKKKKETKLERRVTAIEAKLTSIEKILKDAKLDGIEKLLQDILSSAKAKAEQ